MFQFAIKNRCSAITKSGDSERSQTIATILNAIKSAPSRECILWLDFDQRLLIDRWALW